MTRAWWGDDEGGGIYLGQGSMYDLREADHPEPRLSRCRSVSPAAARALSRPNPTPVTGPVGFHIPRRAR